MQVPQAQVQITVTKQGHANTFQSWKKLVDLSLINVAANCSGEHIWGVNKGHHIYYRNGKHGKWVKVDG